MPAPLQYIALASVDGYIADARGEWDFAVPDAEVHAFVNELTRPAAMALYGRRMFEVMQWWDRVDATTLPPVERAFASRWREQRKIVYSRTLPSLSVPNTTLIADFDPVEVSRWKSEAQGPLQIGGADIASVAARAGVLDEVHLLTAPAIVGGGTRFLADGLRLDLALIAERRFANGFTYATYSVMRDS